MCRVCIQALRAGMAVQTIKKGMMRVCARARVWVWVSSTEASADDGAGGSRTTAGARGSFPSFANGRGGLFAARVFGLT